MFFYKSTEGERIPHLISSIRVASEGLIAHAHFGFAQRAYLHTIELMFYMAFTNTWHQVFATSLSALQAVEVPTDFKC
jgi:hypothetical protein